MSTSPTPPDPATVHELWLRDLAAEGLAAFQRYLAKHAAFAAFLATREGPGLKT
jgi:hypothetical protein